MVEFAAYEDAVVHTLRTQAVRSAILIDDAFPSFRDLLSDGTNKETVKQDYPDWQYARELYEFLHNQRIICDVENHINKVDSSFIEKIRKSDLVVLDWNLRSGDHENSDDAIEILGHLSRSKHFNLVVVYTRATDLAAVWRRAAAHLRGGWRDKEAFTAKLDSAIDPDNLFDALDDTKAGELVTDALLDEYVIKGRRALSPETLRPFQELLEGQKVEKKNQTDIVEALIHRVAKTKLGVNVDNTAARPIEGTPSGTVPYITCGSVFVAFMRKLADNDASKRSIFDCLDDALKAWRPNLLQLLVSELQNELEQNSYAFDKTLVSSDALKAGWLFHTLKTYKDAAGREDALDAITAGLNRRIIEALDNAISAQMSDQNSSLLTFGREAARLAIGAFSDDVPENELVIKAMELTRIEKKNSDDILHALNEYLSSDTFRGGYISTGTVLCTENRKQWFLCVSPACDMEPRRSKDNLSWSNELHPLRSMNLIRLECCGLQGALADAEYGVQVFVSVDGRRYALRAVHEETRLPWPRTCFLGDGSAKLPAQPKEWHQYAFQVFNVSHSEGRPQIQELSLFAVAQLRPAYAARFQHLNGVHQSRIGVDFVNFGKKAEDKK